MKCYDNIVLAGNLNIDSLGPSKDTPNYLSDQLDFSNLKNLVKEPTCFMSDKGSLIDIVLTNKPRSLGTTFCYKHKRFWQISCYCVEVLL